MPVCSCRVILLEASLFSHFFDGGGGGGGAGVRGGGGGGVYTFLPKSGGGGGGIFGLFKAIPPFAKVSHALLDFRVRISTMTTSRETEGRYRRSCTRL